MSATCGPEARAVTETLGFSCLDVNPVVSLNDPTALASWTQPVLEVVIISGAILALLHAIRRLRNEGDPTNLSLWFASLVYLAVTEPPLYFPEWFGLDKIYGLIFAHNEFTVQFMYDRLPLYIVAFYPAISALAYETVRSMGVFRRRGPLVGAVLVAFVSQVFYEIFDQLGPQLQWWAWNGDNVQVNRPMFASVPVTSMLLFASVSIGVLTYLVVRLVGVEDQDGSEVVGTTRRPARSRRSIVTRTIIAGALTPLGMLVAGIPSSIFGGDSPRTTVQAWILGVELALVWAAGIWLLVREWRTAGQVERPPLNRFVTVFPVLYLAAHAVFWLAALPAYLDATDGRTASGTPIGSGPYVLACYAGALGILAVLFRGRTRVPAPSGDAALAEV